MIATLYNYGLVVMPVVRVGLSWARTNLHVVFTYACKLAHMGVVVVTGWLGENWGNAQLRQHCAAAQHDMFHTRRRPATLFTIWQARARGQVSNAHFLCVH